MPRDGAGGPEIAAAVAPGRACVYWYRSRDCSTELTAGCGLDWDSVESVQELRWAGRPWADDQHGVHPGEVVIGLYEPGPSPPSPP
jgi:hypothetical protein